MELKEIKEDLFLIAKELNHLIPDTKWYLFGSILTNKKACNDVDLLILYKDYSDVNLIKQYTNLIDEKYPIDYTFLSYEEEKEFDFIKNQRAYMVFPLT